MFDNYKKVFARVSRSRKVLLVLVVLSIPVWALYTQNPYETAVYVFGMFWGTMVLHWLIGSHVLSSAWSDAKRDIYEYTPGLDYRSYDLFSAYRVSSGNQELLAINPYEPHNYIEEYRNVYVGCSDTVDSTERSDTQSCYIVKFEALARPNDPDSARLFNVLEGTLSPPKLHRTKNKAYWRDLDEFADAYRSIAEANTSTVNAQYSKLKQGIRRCVCEYAENVENPNSKDLSTFVQRQLGSEWYFEKLEFIPKTTNWMN